MMLRPVLFPVPNLNLTPPQRVVQQQEVARQALGVCAESLGLSCFTWNKNAAGIPVPTQGYYWSISHKPRWAAAVIADHPVGIDIERIKPRGSGLFEKLGEDEEWSLMGGRGWPEFFRLWTAKEAVLKANGRGIGDLPDCRVTEMTDPLHLVLQYSGCTWKVEHFYHDGHIAALTVGDEAVDWCVGNFP